MAPCFAPSSDTAVSLYLIEQDQLQSWLTDQPAFKTHITDHPPVARRLATRVFSIPMHHELTDAQIKQVAEAVTKVANAFTI